MFESYTVGAVFQVRNEAASTLTSILRQIEAIDVAAGSAQKNLSAMSAIRFGALSNSMGAFERRLTGVAVASQEMRITFAENMEAINAGLMMATRTARELAAAMGAVAGASRVAAGATGGGGGGGRRGGGHLSASAPLGPFHARSGVGLGLGTLGLLGYAAYQEAEVEDIAARLMFTSGIPVGAGMTGTSQFARIRGAIQSGAASTGYAPGDIGEALLGAFRLTGGTMKFDQQLGLAQTLMPYAATEARLKPATSIEEALPILIGLAHMTGEYRPDRLPALANQFAYASTMTDAPITQFSRALSYSLPVLHAGMGMDPGAVMMMTAMMQRAGITSTKSGTWQREFFTRLMPKTSLISNAASRAQMGGLERLGLVTGGKPNWMVPGPGGQVDWDASIEKLSTEMYTGLQKIPQTQRLGVLRQVFGAQGGGFGALMNLPQFVDQLPILIRGMQNFRGGTDFLQQYTTASPVQQFREELRDLQNVLMDIGTVALPPLLKLLHGLDDTLKSITGKGGAPGPAGIAGTTAAGAILGSVIPGVGTAAGAAIGAGAGMIPAAKTGINNALSVGIDPFTGLPIMTPQSTAKTGNTVTIGQITVNAQTNDPHDLADMIVGHLNDKLSNSFTNNLGPGQSTSSSPFNSGGGP